MILRPVATALGSDGANWIATGGEQAPAASRPVPNIPRPGATALGPSLMRVPPKVWLG
jgi:hypothetical protein